MEGAEIHVISASPSQLKSPDQLGVNIWFHHVHVPKWKWGKTLFAGVSLQIHQLISTLHLDIVHGQGTERDCAMAAILSGRPNVITIHGNMRALARRPEHKGSLYYQLAALLEAFALKRTDGVVAISRYTQTLVSPFASRTWLIPNAVDPRFFDITLLPPPVPRVLFVGSLIPAKNPLGLLEACTPLLETGQCTLALAGQLDNTSAYGAAFHQLANQLPNIEFLGFLNRDALAQEFSQSSILVLPTFEDNCPMVVLEAMAAGLPVAASHVGGIPDLISDGVDGLMFDPSHPEAIRSTLATLIHQPSLRSTLGQEAKRKALGHFHPKVIAQQHLDLYRECLNHTAI